ncbi:MAG TPA: T9SS type A sorting domain-containing protein [Flavobacteriales bacterium]|nr:T9SS type A sorting domain-containing protein [Flavobacteriales bacterium]
MRVLITVIFVICGFVQVCAQAHLSFGNGEKLVPLSVNATLLKASAHSNGQLLKSGAQSDYFILDTLQLPFIDDFSSNWMKNYDVANYTLIKTDSVAFSFTVDGFVVDSLLCALDTTFSYVLDTLDTSISKTPLPAFQKVNYNDPYNPFVPTDTSYCWVPYYVYDTLGMLTPDTCFVELCTYDNDTLDIDTLYNVYDTLDVYGADTIGAGVSLSLWIDDLAYINNTYPIDPVTIGVATLDGLDEKGAPHNNFSDPSGYGVADYLTSKPIDLTGTPGDSIFLSFYYQPEGMGNNPQLEDSLVLEFYAPKKRTWHNIWSLAGTSQQDFERVMIHITSSDYLEKGFRFRFKNYATISGNFDHWHIDYIRLADSRGLGDTVIINDVAFIYDAPSIIKNYEAIPWKHFLKDTINQLDTSFQLTVTNLDTQGKQVAHQFYIVDSFDSVLIDTVTSGVITVDYVGQFGFSTIPVSMSYNCYSPANGCFSPNTDYATLEVVNTLSIQAGDVNNSNDTLRNDQVFHNYYAYDDGSAEAAYSLVGNGSKIAYKFSTITPDTIRAIDIFFAQTTEDVSSENFYLTVWSSIGPDVIEYQQAFHTPKYEDSLNEFHTYVLDEILVLTGNYFIGFVQENDVDMNVGFDKNTVSNTNLYFNTSGTWTQSVIPGAIMMRPLFGDTVIIPAGTPEYGSNNGEELEIEYVVYPNPGKDIIYFEQQSRGQTSDFDEAIEMRIIDLYGRIVMKIPASENSADVSNLSEGIYFFEFLSRDSGKSTTKKILITR